MKVADLKIGELYIIKDNVIWRENVHEWTPGRTITTCQIWKTWLREISSMPKQTFIYLGCTYENWSFYGVKKHHWFLMGSNRVRVDGRHVKLLEKVDEGTI